ncbi:MAG: hypothetical protein K9W43_11775 [Candidatus Thorarchaeota archaeon]|nr:hypothetical protein [Candidatus Thorarchaeota archaeon]
MNEVATLRELIDDFGPENVIREIGLKRIVEEYGLKQIVEEVGLIRTFMLVDKLIAEMKLTAEEKESCKKIIQDMEKKLGINVAEEE